MFVLAVVVFVAAQLASSEVHAEALEVSGVRLDFQSGSLSVQGIAVPPPLDGAGRPVYVLPISEVPSLAVAGDRLLLKYFTKAGGDRERGFTVLEFKAVPARYSNLLPLSSTPTWDDNHYVRPSGQNLHFGVYLPKRMQFIYRDGVLAIDDGQWMGPPAPQRYIEPDAADRGPCFNVANVPECLAEIERYESAKRTRPKAKQPYSASSGASPGVTR